MKKLLLLLSLILVFLAPLKLLAQPKLDTASVDRNVVYGMYSGLALIMDVYYPHNPNGYGIIQISGSGWTRPMGLDARMLNHQSHVTADATPMLAAGYTVFTLNHRATPRFTYPAQVEDVQRAVRFIRYHADKYQINPDKIGAIGGSSAGHLVSMLGLLNGDEFLQDDSPINQVNAKVQCVVARAAPSNFLNGQDANYFLGFREKERALAGSIEYKIAQAASPITHVTPDDAPILLAHGDADESVLFEQSESMYQKLQETGVPSRLLRIEGGGHGFNFSGAKNKPDLAKIYVQWMDKHLRGL